MSQKARQSVEIACTECRFSKVVGPDDEKAAADYVVEHGKETGHKVSITSDGE